MVYICCVPTCDSVNEKTHSFPKNENACQKWINATKLFKLNKKTAWSTHHQVCHKHFKRDDYTSNCFRFLKKGVIPSLDMPVLNVVTEHSYCDPNSVQLGTKPFESIEMEIPEPTNMTEDIQAQDVDPPHDIYDKNVYKNVEMELDETGEHLEMALPTIDCAETMNENVMITDDVSMDNVTITDDNNDDPIADNVSMAHDHVTITDDNDDDDDTMADNFCNDTSEQDNENHTPKLNQKSSRTYDPVARKLRYQSTRMTYLTKRIRELENPKDSTLNKYLSSKLNVEQNNFVQMMLRNSGKKKQGWRFTTDDKNLALSAYKQSPKAYRHTRKFFGGPGKTTIYEHAAFVRFQAGINPKLFEFIKSAVNNLDEDDKHVTVSWDEMSLQTHLDFNSVKDYIDGFVDYGEHREMRFGTHALVFMVRGIVKEFKQPVAYFITENINSIELCELIRLVIEAILDTGLKVVGSVSDAVQINRSAVNKLRSNLTRDAIIEYTVKGCKIIHFYDPPHLLKSLRNNLLVKNLKHVVVTCTNENDNLEERKEKTEYDKANLEERTASWADVKDFYDYNRKGTQRLLPKIRDEHIKPVKRKMKVDIAAQVFSRSYGRAMRSCSDNKQLSRDFTGTADLLCFFNDVFDSLNGGGVPKQNTLICSINESSYHFEFWEYAVGMIKKMKFDKLNGRKDSSKVLSDYIVTIKGLSELTRRMLKITDTVSLRRMTQDALKNFFGGIRGFIFSPSVREFRGAYGSMMVNNLSCKHSIDSNCEADNGIPLLKNFHSLLSSSQTQNHNNSGGITVENENYEEVNESTYAGEYESLSLVTNEALDYVAGDVCKKLLKKLECVSCRSYIERNSSQENVVEGHPRRGILAYPSESFMKCFKTLVIHGEKVLPNVCMEKNFKERFGREIEFESKISCEEHVKEIQNKLLDITFEYIVLNFTKSINRKLKGNDVDILPINQIEKQASDFYKKKRKIGKYVPKLDVNDQDVSKISVTEKDAIKKSLVKKDAIKNPVIKKQSIKPVIKKGAIKKPVIKKSMIKNAVMKKTAIIENVKMMVPIKKSSVHTMKLRN